MKHSLTRQFSSFIIPASLAFTNFAFAEVEECTSDDDCIDGSACEKSMATPGCNPEAGGDCGSSLPYEAEIGYCMVQPVECSSNDDCGEYLTCAVESSSGCWANSDGSSGCDEVETHSFCSTEMVSCSADEQCPREFECSFYEICPEIACAEGEECPKVECSPSSEGQCSPKSIDCFDNSDCPSEWSCYGTSSWECPGDIGAGGSGSDGEGSGCVEDTVQGYCHPDALAQDLWASTTDVLEGSDLPAPETGDKEEDENDADDDSEGEDDDGVGNDSGPANQGNDVEDDIEEGEDATPDAESMSGSDDGFDAGNGCSVTSADPRREGAWGWLLMFALPLLRRRRGEKA